jgi:hypothetical protein
MSHTRFFRKRPTLFGRESNHYLRTEVPMDNSLRIAMAL